MGSPFLFLPFSISLSQANARLPHSLKSRYLIMGCRLPLSPSKSHATLSHLQAFAQVLLSPEPVPSSSFLPTQFCSIVTAWMTGAEGTEEMSLTQGGIT